MTRSGTADRSPAGALRSIPARRQQSCSLEVPRGRSRKTLVRSHITVKRTGFGSGNPVYPGSVRYAAGPYRPEDVLARRPQPGAQATASRDYEAVSGTLQFAVGETEKSFTVPILDDRVFDCRKSFAVRLSDPAYDAALTFLPRASYPYGTMSPNHSHRGSAGGGCSGYCTSAASS